MRVFSIVLYLFLASCVNAQSVSVEEFDNGLKKHHPQLLDVRTADEFNQGRLSGAMLADVREIKEFYRRIAALDKDQPVYVYCLGGSRSEIAATIMKEEGFSNIIELKGGYSAWQAEGKPVEGATPVPLISKQAFEGIVSSAPLVFVTFTAPWCPPCRRMAPVLDTMKIDYAGNNRKPHIMFTKIDGGAQALLMKQMGVEQMPGFIFYKDGKEVWRGSGVIDKKELQTTLDQYSN